MTLQLSYIIAAFVTGICGPLILLFIQSKLDKRKKSDMLTDTLAVGDTITNILDDILDELDADRVWITQFHNGGHYYPTGKSMAKFSMLYEAVDANVNSVQAQYQNIPVNIFSKAINRLLAEDQILVSDFSDHSIATYGLRQIAESTGCKSGYIFAIKTPEGKFIGALGIDYIKATKLQQTDIDSISYQAAGIGGVLMNYLK